MFAEFSKFSAELRCSMKARVRMKVSTLVLFTLYSIFGLWALISLKSGPKKKITWVSVPSQNNAAKIILQTRSAKALNKLKQWIVAQ